MAHRADSYGSHGHLSPATFEIVAFAETLSVDELRLFVKAVKLLVAGIITTNDFQKAADLYQAGRVSRVESLSFLCSRGIPS